jgi:hypothetical protein
MRRVSGWLLVLVGVAALIVGLAVAVAFGPDDTLAVGPHQISTTGVALISAPGALSYAGPTLQVAATAEQPGAPIFVGVGHDVDVRDYLSGSAYTQIDKVSLPWRAETSDVPGRTRPIADPSELTWWLTTGSGRGAATVMLPLLDAPIDVVVIIADGAPGFTTEVTVGILQEGIFPGAMGVLLGGVGLLVAGRLVLRGSSAARS